MEPITSTKDLYIEFTRDIYHAEVLLIPELRFFIEKTKVENLKKALNSHLANTRSHVTHLEEIQELMDADILNDHCRTMKSMIMETKELVDRCLEPALLERAMVVSLNRITQCKITVYEMLVSMADELHLPEHKELLEQCLTDERVFEQKVKEAARISI